MGPEKLSAAHHRMDGLVVVAVSGEIDAVTAPELATAIELAIAGSFPLTGMIVDLTGVHFLAAAGLTVLITTHEEVTPRARFAVVADGAAARSITVLGLDAVITLHDTLQAAAQDLGGG